MYTIQKQNICQQGQNKKLKKRDKKQSKKVIEKKAIEKRLVKDVRNDRKKLGE